MSDTSEPPRLVALSLSLSLEERWTLHHVLLDRIEREAMAADATCVDPPPIEVFQAFETLDAGDTRFTLAQLEAIRTLLGEYHHAPLWELERPRFEELLYRVSNAIERRTATPHAD